MEDRQTIEDLLKKIEGLERRIPSVPFTPEEERKELAASELRIHTHPGCPAEYRKKG